jgi:threonine synthase
VQYYSLKDQSKTQKVSFKDAVIRGLAVDGGLYFPETINPLPQDFFETISTLSNEEIAYQAIRQFVGDEIPEKELKQIVAETINFDFPTIQITENSYSLELYHGPTLAFKDVGARFMARCLAYFNKDKTRQVTVLVATSGDTGSAVANGFLGVKGVDVIILYPSGKVSPIQEKQLTTLGQNIVALEVDGVFDDCQALVKKAFNDTEIISKRKLTSANSINVARWLPQMFYYFFAYKQLKSLNKELIISVPSGNFGNICAGLLADKLGLPIKQFIASTNANDVVTNYLKTTNYSPKKTVQTISNAMDVADPSNFVRILELFNGKIPSKKLVSYSFSDKETKTQLLALYKSENYLCDPHGAVAYLGLTKVLKDNPNAIGIFLETAHPIKFIDVVSAIIEEELPIPADLKALFEQEKSSILMANDYSIFKNYLISSNS